MQRIEDEENLEATDNAWGGTMGTSVILKKLDDSIDFVFEKSLEKGTSRRTQESKTTTRVEKEYVRGAD